MHCRSEAVLPAVTHAIVNDGVGGGQDCIVILKNKRETNDRCNVFSVWNRNLLPVCVLLFRAVSGCGSHSPAWRGIDSGYDSQSSQPGDVERSANLSHYRLH
jgi:hypothetical protein